jgi:hypothetical protein
VGGKHEFYAGEKISTAVSAELKVALSATADVVFGTKNTFHAATEVNAHAGVKARVAATRLDNRLTAIENDVTSIQNKSLDLENAVTSLHSSVLHLIT